MTILNLELQIKTATKKRNELAQRLAEQDELIAHLRSMANECEHEYDTNGKCIHCGSTPD